MGMRSRVLVSSVLRHCIVGYSVSFCTTFQSYIDPAIANLVLPPDSKHEGPLESVDLHRGKATFDALYTLLQRCRDEITACEAAETIGRASSSSAHSASSWVRRRELVLYTLMTHHMQNNDFSVTLQWLEWLLHQHPADVGAKGLVVPTQELGKILPSPPATNTTALITCLKPSALTSDRPSLSASNPQL
eukprot:1179693-Prorocentrum_minimum.AAC.1